MIAAALKNRLLPLFGTAVIDQAVLSAANFAVGLILIRYTSSSDYGHYVLAYAAVALAVTMQGAWVTGPLMVLSSKKSEEDRRLMIGSIHVSQNLMLRRLATPLLILISGLWLAGVLERHQALVLLAGILAGWMALKREFLRSILLIYTRSHSLLAVDTVYVVALVGLAVLAVFGPLPAAPMSVLALAGAAAAGGWPAAQILADNPGWTPGDPKPYWREMRPLAIWAATGAAIYWGFSQGYNYLLALKLDTTAVAAVAAARLLLQPANLMSTGIKGVLMPMSSRWLVESGFAVLMRRLGWFLLGVGLLDGLYFILLWLGNDWLLDKVLKKQIPDHDFLLLMWAVLAVLNLVRDIYQGALIARERLRALAWVAGFSTVAALLTMWFAITAIGARGAMWGLLVGETISTLGVLILCSRELRISAKPA